MRRATGSCSRAGPLDLCVTLAETSELLALKASDTAKASAVLDITLEKIREAEARIERLTDIRDVLRALADDCPVDVPVTDCPILTFLSTRHDSRRTEAHT